MIIRLNEVLLAGIKRTVWFVSWIGSSGATFAPAMAHLALPTASFSSEDYIL